MFKSNFKHIATAFLIISSVITVQGQAKDPDPLRFEAQIAEFNSLDQCFPPSNDVILFIGSSSFRMWTDAEHVFRKYKVINRGFGGSHFSDVHHYFDDLIARYDPKAIVLYEGDNDITSGKSPERVQNDFKTLVEQIEEEKGELPIALVSIKPSPARWRIADKMIAANQQLEDYCDSKSNLTFIDIWQVMLTAGDTPDKTLYIGDGVHMNQCGYKLWEKIMLDYLETL